MKRPRIRVSDHAVVCYLERVRGVDVEAIRMAIGRRVELALDHPGATGVLSEGFEFIVRDRTVVTIELASRPPKTPGKRHGRRSDRDE